MNRAARPVKHVIQEGEVNRIERHQHREQCRRTGRRATTGDPIAHGNQVRPNPPRERRGDATVIKVELSIADACLRFFYGRPRCALIGCALVNVLNRSSVALFQIFGSIKLPLGPFEPCRRNIELGGLPRQPNLVRASIDGEEEISLLNDVAVFEEYAGERATDLAAQLDLRDGRKLAEKAQTRVEVLD